MIDLLGDRWRVVTREELGKPNAFCCDVSAGNRHIWGKDKIREDVIFLDKEPNLKIKPDVLAEWRRLPFPDDYFRCTVFDPPFYSGNVFPYYTHPEENNEKGYNGTQTWYGYPFKTKHELKVEILKAQKEIARVSPRMCLKWMNRDLTVDQVLTLFTEWKPVWVQPFKGKHNYKNGSTFWVKMVRRVGQTGGA